MKAIVYLFVFLPLLAASQTSVEEEVNRINREKVDRYISVSDGLEKGSDSVSLYLTNALRIAEQISYHDGISTSYQKLIKHHEQDDEAFKELEYALRLSIYLEENGTMNQLGESYLILGNIYFREFLFDKCSDILKKANKLKPLGIDLKQRIYLLLVKSEKKEGEIENALMYAKKFEELKDNNPNLLLSLYEETARIYHEVGAYEKELEIYYAEEELLTKIKKEEELPIVWNNIGFASKYLNKYKESKTAFGKLLTTNNLKNTREKGIAHYNLGLIYQNESKLDSALYHFNRGASILKSNNDWELANQCLNMEATVYYQKSDDFNALQSINDAIIIGIDHDCPKQLAKTYEIKSLVHKDLYEYEQALVDYQKYLSIRDSLAAIEIGNERARLFNRYIIEEHEKGLRLNWAEDQMNFVNLARLEAEKEAQKQAYIAKEKEQERKIFELKNKDLLAKQILDALRFSEQQLTLQNKETELALSQRENELKELALEKVELEKNRREREITMLAQRNELQKEKQLREQEEFSNKLRFVFSILLFILLLLLGMFIAYRQLRKRKRRIEIQSAIIEKNRLEIEREKEKSDGLLLNILPAAVAEELKSDGVSKPRYYDEISVGFTDFAGFTQISEKLSPEELVRQLDRMFLEFDRIIENYSLQRIKTIGDAYMFAAGLPESLEDHAEKCIQAALELRNFIADYNNELPEDAPKWNIRIGVNSGPVVAGVIGVKKFAYDIWGDTVNTASRMESSGEIGKVNVSGSTFKMVQNKFKTEYRGRVEAKNKGAIDMYFVENN